MSWPGFLLELCYSGSEIWVTFSRTDSILTSDYTSPGYAATSGMWWGCFSLYTLIIYYTSWLIFSTNRSIMFCDGSSIWDVHDVATPLLSRFSSQCVPGCWSLPTKLRTARLSWLLWPKFISNETNYIYINISAKTG